MLFRKNPFIRNTGFFSLCFFILTATTGAQSISDWQQDIDEIVKDISAYHPDPFTKTGRVVFLREAEKLREEIPVLTEEQRTVRAMRLVALVGDGHTQLEPNKSSFAYWYPFRIYEFTDGYFVTSAHKSVADLAGAQVLEIAGKPVAEVVEDARNLMDDENEIDRKERLYPVHNSAMMKGLGYADADGKLKVKFKLRDGKIVERILTPRMTDDPRFKDYESSFEWQFRGEMFGMPFDTVNDWISAYKNLPAVAFRTADNARPLHLTQRVPYTSRSVPEKNAYYIQLNQVDDTAFVPFIRGALEEIDKLKPQRLILDLRYNFGGDGSKVFVMIDEFIKRKGNPPWKEMYLLTGRKTFSAGVMVVDSFLKHIQLTVVGEPAGAALNSFGDATTRELKSTGLRLDVSTLRHQLSSSDDFRKFIPVDVPAQFSFADYVAGRDPAIDGILSGKEMRSIPIIALDESGRAARKAFESRKAEFSKYDWWQPPTEIELRNICQIKVEQKRLEEALDVCQLGTEIYPYNWHTWYNYGKAQRDAGLVAERLQSYRKVLEIDPNNINLIQLQRALTDGLKPAVVRYSATVADTEKALTGLCKTMNTRLIEKPFLPDVKQKQMQIDCEGFQFLGNPRHTEFVFRDDSLEMVWIMTTAEEEPSILKNMIEVNGEPTRRGNKYIAFEKNRTALRLDRKEVLFYSETLVPEISKWLE